MCIVPPTVLSLAFWSRSALPRPRASLSGGVYIITLLAELSAPLRAPWARLAPYGVGRSRRPQRGGLWSSPFPGARVFLRQPRASSPPLRGRAVVSLAYAAQRASACRQSAGDGLVSLARPLPPCAPRVRYASAAKVFSFFFGWRVECFEIVGLPN